MAFVLVHSPMLGPSSWEPVARLLRGKGHVTVVPDLRPAAAEPTIWAAQAEAVVSAIPDAPDRTYWIVAHSGAGPLLPVIRTRLDGPPAGYMFVDAAFPHPGKSRLDALPQDLVDRLHALVEDGVLPPWTDWFDVEEIERLLPDPQIRQALVSELPRVPIQMFEETLPESRGWPNAVCCYLRLSPAYVEDSVRAVSAACRIAVFDGNHLSIVTDPEGVTQAMLDLAGPIRV